MSGIDEIHDVTDWPRLSEEQMGAKLKFWCQHPDGHLVLFKQSRGDAGEHWSEKIASEIASLIGLPHPEIDLASYRGFPGTISRDFTVNQTEGSLVHGNELMLELDPSYPSQGANFKVAQHTLDRIFMVVGQSFIDRPAQTKPEPDIQSATDVFLGYLLLDSLIANTDRHHANWGILLKPSLHGRGRAELAPTFDHASSLGRELTDPSRREKLRPLRRDQTVVGYLESPGGRSRIFAHEHDLKPLRAMEVFARTYQSRQPAAEAWLRHLDAVGLDQYKAVIDRVPLTTMSGPSREFALRLLQLNRQALLTRSFRYE